MTAKELIKHLMTQKNVSNAEMANSLEISQAALWDRLNPKKTNNMTVSVMNKMLGILGYKIAIIPVDAVLPEEGFVLEGKEV
jgi:predicted XRE-type DNA-binding protein